MEYFVNCNTASIDPYTGPLDKQKAEHLYRRLGFSASVETINFAITQPVGTLIDSLIAEALNLAPTATPIWADWNNDNYPADDDLRRQMVNDHRSEWLLAYTKKCWAAILETV